MAPLSWPLEGALLVALWATALVALLGPGLFRSIVMFIVFGLLMALAWVRLGAIDLALAEAAIGAGLTGCLLLDAIGHLQRGRHTTAKALRAPTVEDR